MIENKVALITGVLRKRSPRVSFEPRSNKTTEISLKLRSIFDNSVSGQKASRCLFRFNALAEDGR